MPSTHSRFQNRQSIAVAKYTRSHSPQGSAALLLCIMRLKGLKNCLKPHSFSSSPLSLSLPSSSLHTLTLLRQSTLATSSPFPTHPHTHRDSIFFRHEAPDAPEEASQESSSRYQWWQLRPCRILLLWQCTTARRPSDASPNHPSILHGC